MRTGPWMESALSTAAAPAGAPPCGRATQGDVASPAPASEERHALCLTPAPPEKRRAVEALVLPLAAPGAQVMEVGVAATTAQGTHSLPPAPSPASRLTALPPAAVEKPVPLRVMVPPPATPYTEALTAATCGSIVRWNTPAPGRTCFAHRARRACP